jgi:hypothetical protein
MRLTEERRFDFVVRGIHHLRQGRGVPVVDLRCACCEWVKCRMSRGLVPDCHICSERISYLDPMPRPDWVAFWHESAASLQRKVVRKVFEIGIATRTHRAGLISDTARKLDVMHHTGTFVVSSQTRPIQRRSVLHTLRCLSRQARQPDLLRDGTVLILSYRTRTWKYHTKCLTGER